VIILQSRIAGATARSLERFAARARRSVGLDGRVDVLIGSSTVLRDLNRRFRQKDRATDVLSFPAEHAASNGFAGDIAISAEIAGANARRYGHSVADELKILLLHGMLHLAGYDHERDAGAMAAREQRLRAEFRLKDSLIARNSNARVDAGDLARGRRRRKTTRRRSSR
jgi:probable rRNA maturation factor